jgi:hypothetical protein
MPHEKYAQCIDACNDCATACNHCAASCLAEDDVKMMAKCIALDIDCAAFFQLAAAAMARGSAYAGAICKLCAEICKACGDECAKHKAKHCKDCAKACHRCADECLKMAQ